VTTTPVPTAVALPAAHSARAPHLGDVPEIFALVSEYDRQHLTRPDVAEDDVRADLEDRLVDREHGCWLVHGPDGRAVGYAVTWWDPDNSEFVFDPYVRPGADPALWEWLLSRCLGRAADLRAEHGGDVVLEGGCYAQDQVWSGRLASTGLAVVRRFWRMTIPLDPAAPTPAPELADGVRIRLVDVDDEADLRRLHHVVDESFAEHFGAHHRDFETWWTDTRGKSGFDPSQWWLALVDGQEAAALIGSSRFEDVGFGYIRTLGTLGEYRGRGLGKALLRTAFRSYAQRGLVGAELGVDSDNATGATRLYEAVGMSVEATIEIWRGTLTAAGVEPGGRARLGLKQPPEHQPAGATAPSRPLVGFHADRLSSASEPSAAASD
jgi:ribosomal protein S18 acetylase RimI-like enzyme